jgi:transposase-like protein
VKINGKQHYLWRAVDQDGEVVDVFLQAKRDGAAAKRFFKRLMRNHGGEPRKIVTDKLRSYGVAHRELMPGVIHDNSRYAITGQSNRMRRPGFESAGCGVLNRWGRLSNLLPPMLPSRIYSIWVGTM